jgi:hypothetical protein
MKSILEVYRMNRWTVLIATAILFVLVAVGCSNGGSSPVAPTSGDLTAATADSGAKSQTHLWGYYDVYIDIPSQTVEAVPNREVMFAANVVTFLNGNPANLAFNIKGTPTAPAGAIDVDIDVSIKHPFTAMPQYNGYDVRGIFIGDGSLEFNQNAKLKYAAHNSTTDQEMYDYHLTAGDPGVYGNPDGYTRWWNPAEFLTPGLFGYTPGMVATPGYKGTATVNPYKYFADGLTVSGSAWTFLTTTAGDGVFSSGKTNTRNYYLRFPSFATKGVKFNYAVVANWINETTHPANAPEEGTINVVVTPDVYWVSDTDKGGKLKLDMSFPTLWSEIPTSIWIESTVLSAWYECSGSELIPTGGGVGYSTWHVEIPADNILGNSTSMYHEFWVKKDYDGFDYKSSVPNNCGNDKLESFFRYELYVSDKAYNKPPVCDLVVIGPQTGWDEVNCVFDATGSSDPDVGDTITFAWDFNGNGVYGESPADDYTGPPDKPVHKWLADYVGNVNLKVTDSKGLFDECTVQVNIDVKPTTLYLYDGDTDNGTMSEIGFGAGGASWTYLANEKVWDENGNTGTETYGECKTLATPKINIPSGVTSVKLEITHSGSMPSYYGYYSFASGMVGYTTNGGSTINFDMAPCNYASNWLTFNSGYNFDHNYPYGNLGVYPNYWLGCSPWSNWNYKVFCLTWGSMASPVTTDWTTIGLLGKNDVQICFNANMCPYSWIGYLTGWQLHKVKVYLVP